MKHGEATKKEEQWRVEVQRRAVRLGGGVAQAQGRQGAAKAEGVKVAEDLRVLQAQRLQPIH